jgi:hypothetical protein
LQQQTLSFVCISPLLRLPAIGCIRHRLVHLSPFQTQKNRSSFAPELRTIG